MGFVTTGVNQSKAYKNTKPWIKIDVLYIDMFIVSYFNSHVFFILTIYSYVSYNPTAMFLYRAMIWVLCHGFND